MSNSYLGENLIFIISQPRSGSTLLQRVLSGHSEVVASSEPWLMLNPVYGRREAGVWAEYGADWAVQGVNEFLEHYTDGPKVYDDGIRAFAKTVYDNALKKGGGTWFIDKTPRYILIVEDLIRLFPQAKFIFLLRNPLSVLASIVNTQIAHDLTTLERFAHELLDGPGAILDGMDALGERAIVVRYEEFVQSPEQYTKEICTRIGIGYEAGMEDYSGTEPVKGFMQDRTGIQQHSRPNEARVESWRQLLNDPQQIHFAMSYLQELGQDTFNRLGYSYEELNEAVRSASERNRGKVPLPWSSALTDPRFKRGLDQLSSAHYKNVRDNGNFIGSIKSIGSFIDSVVAQVRWTFGRTRGK